jgi:hypothetical protein
MVVPVRLRFDCFARVAPENSKGVLASTCRSGEIENQFQFELCLCACACVKRNLRKAGFAQRRKGDTEGRKGLNANSFFARFRFFFAPLREML